MAAVPPPATPLFLCERACALPTQRQIELGVRLITALRSEATLWNDKLAQFQTAASCLLGDCLVSAAYAVYGGDLPLDMRRTQLTDTWAPYLRVWDVAISQVRTHARVFVCACCA